MNSAPGPSSTVTLRDIDADTVRDICRLAVAPDQERFVAPNAVSLAQAHFSEDAWFRAIYADDTPVGFVMLEDRPSEPLYFLWRYMIDARYQRMGFGRRAMHLVLEHVRGRPGATCLITSVVPEAGGPQPFYESLGFRLTGDFDDGEAVLRLDFTTPDAGDGSRA